MKMIIFLNAEGSAFKDAEGNYETEMAVADVL